MSKRRPTPVRSLIGGTLGALLVKGRNRAAAGVQSRGAVLVELHETDREELQHLSRVVLVRLHAG
jgi:hypothetical protein